MKSRNSGTTPGIVRADGSRKKVDEWALVLSAEGFSPIIARVSGHWALVFSEAPAEEFDRARQVLIEYEAEATANAEWVVSNEPTDHANVRLYQAVRPKVFAFQDLPLLSHEQKKTSA